MSESPASATPVAARGHNLVFVAPPGPVWAVPVLAGVFERLRGDRTGPVLALCPAESVDEWARVAERLARGTGIRLTGAHAPGRLTRLLRADAVDLVFTTPDTAHELVRRAALKMEGLGGLLLIWPEAWGSIELLEALLPDVPREIQRIVITADPVATAGLVERHCWRAPVMDQLGPALAEPATVVRTAPVAWRRRVEALADLVEQLDPETLAVWVADEGDGPAIADALAAAGTTATVTSGAVPRASQVIAFDLPTPARLRELTDAGDLLLLVPPGAEAYVGRLAARRRPVHLGGLLDRAQARLESARRTIVGVLDRGPGAAAFHAIAPLLERHEAPAVAAALFELWNQGEARSGEAVQVPPAGRGESAPARLWIGAGRRDEIGTPDLVGVLVKECAVPREAIGRVEIRETFSLVELATGVAADAVAERLTGKVVRKRRLVARLDRGRPAEGARPRRT